VSTERAKPPDLAHLVLWALRMSVRIAAMCDVLYYQDDLGGVALYALTRALGAYEPAEGELEHFAASWISKEVRQEVRREKKRAEREQGQELPASLEVEERAIDVLEALLDLSIGEELRSDFEAGVLRDEAAAAVRGEIEQLAPEDQRLVALRYWDELTWPAVAAALGIGISTAKERDERIREHLKRALIAWDRVRPLRRRS
jgi:RNA polymerase sigma factor for flagellar operon FliA